MTDHGSSLRVIYLCNEYPPLPHGGVGVFVRGQATELVRAGHEAIVVGVSRHVDSRHEADDHGVQVVRLPASGKPFVDAIRSASLIRREVSRWLDHPRAVIEGSELSFWGMPDRWAPATIARLHGGHRFFAEAEGRRPKRLRSHIETRSLRSASHIVGVSQYVADRTASLIGLDRGGIRVIYNGVDTSKFSPHPTTRAEPETVAFAGTLCEKKGLRYLVRAIDLLHQRGRRLKLRIAGQDLGSTKGHGSFLDEVLADVSDSTRCDVDYVGALPHDEMAPFYAGASVIVLPSLMEAQGLTWVEAMACARPVVASDRGPGPEVIEDGRSGLLTEPTDARALASTIATVLDDDDLARRLGRAARERAVAQFSLGQATAENLALYHGVANA